MKRPGGKLRVGASGNREPGPNTWPAEHEVPSLPHDASASCAESLSHVRLFATPQTVAPQAPLSMGFPRQEYWSGWPFPSPGDLPNPWIDLTSPALQADSLPLTPPGKLTFSRTISFLKEVIYLFILFLAVLGLHCCAQASSSC